MRSRDGASARRRRGGAGRPARGARAFTLVELLAVVAMLGIVAASAAPALGALSRTRSGMLAREIERRLCLARTHAVATGQPSGVAIDPGAGTISIVRIATSGGAPTPMRDALGAPGAPMSIASAFGGAAVQAFLNGDGATGPGTVWFAEDMTPHVRNGAGASTGAFTTDAVVTLSGGETVTVRATTGAVER